MADLRHPAATAAEIDNPLLRPLRNPAASELRARALRYRRLSQTLFSQEAANAARECARVLEAEAANLEGHPAIFRG